MICNGEERTVFCLKSLTVLILLSFVSDLTPALAQERKIKPGDALEIVVYEQEVLSQTVAVSSEGTVDYPFLTGLSINGITLQRFQEILVAQLSRVMKISPLVIVRFTDTYPVKVTILGQVARPGMYVVPVTSTLQGAVGMAGGFVPGAQLSQIKLIRKNEEKPDNSKNNHEVTKNGRHTDNQGVDIQVVDMKKFYLEGDPRALPALRDGDTVVVPGYPLATTIKVLGSVERPGSYEVTFQTSLLDVLFMAGGPTSEANLSRIKVTSLAGDKSYEVRINLKDLKKTENIPLVEPGDVVYVPKRTITWKKFADLMRDISTFATLYVVIRWGRR